MTNIMTGRERVWAAINMKEVDHIPVGAEMKHFTARHYGVTMADYLADPKLQFELGHKLFEDLGGYDLATIMPPGFDENCGLVMPGMKTLMPGKELPPDSIPQLDEIQLMDPDDYDVAIKKGWNRFAREDLIPRAFSGNPPPLPPPPTAEMEELMRENRSFYEDRGVFLYDMGVPVLLPELTPVRSLSGYLTDLFRRPEKVKALMENSMPDILEEIRTGLEGKEMPMIMSNGNLRTPVGIVSPGQFEQFFFPYFKQLIETALEYKPLIVFHLDTDWTRSLPYFREFPEGKYIVQLDGTSDIFKAKEIIGDRMCIQGDVPATLLKMGTPDEVKSYCKKLIDVIGAGGGFILSAGCSVPYDARFENVKAMFDTAKNYPPPRS